MHQAEDVVSAIAAFNRFNNIFEDVFCVGILNLHWARIGFTFKYQACFEVLYLCLMIVLNGLLVNLHESPVLIRTTRVLAFLCIFMWIKEALHSIAVTIGAVLSGRVQQGLCRAGADLFRLFSTGIVYVYAAYSPETAKERWELNVLMCYTFAYRWIWLTYATRSMRVVGLHILPILYTTRGIGAFCFIMLVYLLAAVTAIYAFALHSLSESISLVLRLVLLGDLDLYEMEYGPGGLDVYGTTLLLDDMSISTSVPPLGENSYAIRLVVLVIASVMGVLLMNIFVAVLCVHYQEASDNSLKLFNHERARLVETYYDSKRGFSAMFCWICCLRLCRRQRLARSQSPSPDKRHNDDSNMNLYMCICRPVVYIYTYMATAGSAAWAV